MNHILEYIESTSGNLISIEVNGKPVGNIRHDMSGYVADISLSGLNPNKRIKAKTLTLSGLSVESIKRRVAAVFREGGILD